MLYPFFLAVSIPLTFPGKCFIVSRMVVLRSFTIQELVIDPDVWPTRRRGIPKKNVAIPNGLWVAWTTTVLDESWAATRTSRRNLATVEQRYSIVGHEPFLRYEVDRRGRSLGADSRGGDVPAIWGQSERRVVSRKSSTFVLVGQKPFGVVSERRKNDVRVGGLSLCVSRLVRAGKLEEERPAFEAKFLRKWAVRTEQSAWVRLDLLADRSLAKPEHIIRRYFPFTSPEEPALAVLFARGNAEAVRSATPNVYREADIGALCREVSGGVLPAWVPVPWGEDVLHLRQLGF